MRCVKFFNYFFGLSVLFSMLIFLLGSFLCWCFWRSFLLGLLVWFGSDDPGGSGAGAIHIYIIVGLGCK